MSTAIQQVQAPVAVSVQTAGYTVPAGRVARVTVNLEGTATFTINGVTALRGTQNTVMSSLSLPSNAGSVATTTNPTTGNVNYAGTSNDQKTVIVPLTFPAGTVLNGTVGGGAFRYVVEEYLA